MPILQKVLNTDKNKVCPDIYFFSTHVYNSREGELRGKTYFNLVDNQLTWIKNKKFLNNINVYIFVNNVQVLKINASSLAPSSNKKQLTGNIDYKIDSKNLVISGYCGNDLIIGDTATEIVLDNDTLVPNSYINTNFLFINKNKDLRILESLTFPSFDIEAAKKINTENYKKQPLSKKSIISYNKSKKAGIGFVIDLEAILYNNSTFYRILSQNENIKNNILENLDLAIENTRFYKKNITKSYQDYQRIESPIFIKKVSNNKLDKKYIITCTDDNTDFYNFNKYKIKIKTIIENPCLKIIKKEFLDSIPDIKKFILEYKNIISLLDKNSAIDESRVFFLENEYIKYFQTTEEGESKILKIINSLSRIFSVSSNIPIENFYSMLVSNFNPLLCNLEIFEKILGSINTLENFYRGIFENSYTEIDGRQTDVKNNIVFELELDDYIDYNYEKNYGYDIITENKYSSNTQEIVNGIKTLKSAEKQNRKNLEISKYFDNLTSDISNNLQYFSISNLLLDQYNLYLLDINPDTQNQIFKESFVKISNYNLANNNYDYVESIYDQLLKQNIYIKTIGHEKNNSKSKLFKDLLFDTNAESRQKSKKTIYETGLEDILQTVSMYKYNKPTWMDNYYLSKQTGLMMYKSYVFKNNKENMTIKYTDDENINNKAALIMLYNNFFLDKPLITGSLHDLYILENKEVNNLFDTKLRFYNQYYIVEKTQQTQQTQQTQYPFKQELLNYNILPIYINRQTIKNNIDNLMSDL